MSHVFGTLSFKEELELEAAFMHIKRERRESLKVMFEGTQLRAKSRREDAQTLAKSAKECKDKLKALPGVDIPKLDVPSLNVHLFDGINLRNLVNFRIPNLLLPNFDLNLIPDIKLGNIPGFDLALIRINLKGILNYKDLLPNISLRVLVYTLAIKWPNINLPSLLFDLSKILSIDFDLLFGNLSLRFPEFFQINLQMNIPHLSLPDVNFPGLPPLDIPTIDFSAIDFSSLHIPGIDFPDLLKVPGFDKVLRLLFELFDGIDLSIIIEELGAEFIADFISSALPFVQQVKSGAQAVKNWGTAASDWHKARLTSTQRNFLVPGDARDACNAIGELLRRSRDEHATLAAIQTTQLAVSTAGLFADLGGATGPAVAAASALAKTCQKVVIMGARYKEMRKINLILSTTPAEYLTSNIFKVSPLLGCYYIANNTTSNVLNILSKNIIQDNWMTDATQNKIKYLDPLIMEAQRFISESRYVLDPVRQSQGMYIEKSSMEKLKEGCALFFKKKFGLAPQSATVNSHKYIGR